MPSSPEFTRRVQALIGVAAGTDATTTMAAVDEALAETPTFDVAARAAAAQSAASSKAIPVIDTTHTDLPPATNTTNDPLAAVRESAVYKNWKL